MLTITNVSPRAYKATENAETRGRIEGVTGKQVKPGLKPPRSIL